MNRTDKFLIGIAFIFLVLSTMSLFGLDGFLRIESRSSSEKNAVAEIDKGSGDFRMKFHNDMAWLPGKEKQKLVYDDAVFTGDGGKVNLKMGESQIALGSNTLVVIRKIKSAKHLNLNYGTLAAQIAKNDRVAIETADGKKFEITADESTKMAIESSKKGTKIVVKSGNAKILKEGQTQAQSLKASDNLEIESPKAEPDPIKLTSPVATQMYSASAKERLKFGWMYGSGRPIKSIDDFTLEISNDPELKTLILKERILGQNSWEEDVDTGSDLYYRVKDFVGNFSEIRKFTFVNPKVPEVTEPREGQDFSVPVGSPANVDVLVSGVNPDGRVWIQVSKNADFSEVILDKNLPDGNLSEPYSSGLYYVRARGVYGQLMTAWSGVRTFSVSETIDEQRLAQLAMPAKILIPNIRYPEELYGNESAAQDYIKQTKPFAIYFERALIEGVDLMVNVQGITDRLKVDRQFPKAWIRPGLSELVYQFEIAGRPKTEPRTHRLFVEMEAPNRVSLKKTGEAKWSPILFARSYEGLLRDGAGNTQRFDTPNASYQFDLPAGNRYTFTVRALGQNKIPISGWSLPLTVETPEASPPPVVRDLAKIDEAAARVAKERSPPSQLALTTLAESAGKVKEVIPRLGAWIWAGVGENYYNVKQTIADAADVTYRNFKGPSTFFESGFLSRSNWGAVLSFKRTPGDIALDNKVVTPSVFVWDTFSLEGLYGLPTMRKMMGLPFVWGLRMGVQTHRYPFLYVDSLSQTVLQARNNLTMGSLGAFANTSAKSLNYHWMMRYQLPLQASTENGNQFTVKPSFAFDGSLGASYLFLNQWRTGLFWYGQFHDYSFTYRTPSILNSGKQTLFYSNVELRMGVDF